MKFNKFISMILTKDQINFTDPLAMMSILIKMEMLNLLMISYNLVNRTLYIKALY